MDVRERKGSRTKARKGSEPPRACVARRNVNKGLRFQCRGARRAEAKGLEKLEFYDL